MQIFNRSLARAYALKWALKRNPKFPDYSNQGGGGDCTNFISQAMLAGGWQVAWGIGRDVRAWFTSKDKSSWAWASADQFRWHIRVTGRAAPCGQNELAWGDVMFVVDGDRALHAMLVTEVVYRSHVHPTAQNEISLCGHSNDRLNYPLKAVVTSYGAQRLEFWKIADMVPDKPQPAYIPGPPPPADLVTEV